MAIFVYNKNEESHDRDKNVYDICRPSILSNPYTHLDLKKTRATYRVSTREEAIEKYAHYFDTMYSGNTDFKTVVDEIYEKFKDGEDIYLGCVCKPLPCHGDIIAKKITSRYIKENFLRK